MKHLFVISAVASVFGVAACSAGSPSASAPSVSALPSASVPTTAMRAWYGVGRENGGGGDINVLAMDITDIASNSGNLSQLRHDCNALGADLSIAKSRAPIPSGAWQAVWMSARNALQVGYVDCAGGFEGGGESLVGKGVSEVRSAAPLLTALSDEFGA